MQPPFIALLYHHVVTNLRGVGLSHLLSSQRFVEQPLLPCWGAPTILWQPQPGRSPCRTQICRGVYGFQAKTFPDLQLWGVTVLPCLWIQRKNHKQTAFHIGVLSCQHRTVLTNLIHNTTLVTELCLRHCTGLHVYVLQSMYFSFGLLKNALILM